MTPICGTHEASGLLRAWVHVPSRRRLIDPRKLFSFFLAGLPGYVLAVALNVVLVERFHLRPWVAYAVVLAVQVSVNFVFVRRFVFSFDPTGKSWLTQYVQFTTGIVGFRMLDWSLYSLIVHLTAVHYVMVQMANVVIFGVGKFLYAKRVMEGERPEVQTGS